MPKKKEKKRIKWPEPKAPKPAQMALIESRDPRPVHRRPIHSLPSGPQPATSARSHRLLVAAISAPRPRLSPSRVSLSSPPRRIGSFAWSHRGLGSARGKRTTAKPRHHQREKWWGPLCSRVLADLRVFLLCWCRFGHAVLAGSAGWRVAAVEGGWPRRTLRLRSRRELDPPMWAPESLTLSPSVTRALVHGYSV